MDFKTSLYLDIRKSKKNSIDIFPVKLQVYSSITRKQKFYSTGIDISKDDYTEIFNNDKNVRGKKKEVKIFLQGIESTAYDIAKDIIPFTFEQFEKKMFRSKSASINVKYHYGIKINELKSNDQISTASNYDLSLKSIDKFLKAKSRIKLQNLSFYNITPLFLNDYESYMIKDEGKSYTTVSMYLRALRTIFNDAISDNEIKQDIYPFGKQKGKYQIPSSTSKKKALTKEQLSILFNSKPETANQQKAKDFWFFSYACNGMNVKDIVLLRQENFQGDTLNYYRAKTVKTKKSNLKEINLFLNDYAKGFIEKYKNLNLGKNDFLFSIISNGDDVVEQQRKIKNFTSYMNLHFNKYAKNLGFEFKISTYWARHSFATLAIRGGASMEFVGEALNHSSPEVTKNYFAGFDDQTKKDFASKLMDF